MYTQPACTRLLVAGKRNFHSLCADLIIAAELCDRDAIARHRYTAVFQDRARPILDNWYLHFPPGEKLWRLMYVRVCACGASIIAIGRREITREDRWNLGQESRFSSVARVYVVNYSLDYRSRIVDLDCRYDCVYEMYDSWERVLKFIERIYIYIYVCVYWIESRVLIGYHDG